MSSKQHKKLAKELERLRRLHGGSPPQDVSSRQPENSAPSEKGVTLGVTRGVTNVPPAPKPEGISKSSPPRPVSPTETLPAPAIQPTEEREEPASVPVQKSAPYAYVKKDLTFLIILMIVMIGLLFSLGWLFSQTAIRESLLSLLG